MPSDGQPTFEVLIADDDPDIRELLAEFFRDRGLVVATAADGRAAVTALERSGGRYRIVLTDINMPGADGFAVLAAARAAHPSAYIVIITGYASIDSAVHAVRAGASDYIAKPFSLGQIDVILHQATARFALEHENRRLAETSALGALSDIESRLTSIEATMTDILSHLAARRA